MAHPRGIMKFSDNIGAARVALTLGRRRLFEVIHRLGFDRSTGVGLPAKPRASCTRPNME